MKGDAQLAPRIALPVSEMVKAFEQSQRDEIR
jgi:hypothetical protein